jgi:GGDEF domain-containing protein
VTSTALLAEKLASVLASKLGTAVLSYWWQRATSSTDDQVRVMLREKALGKLARARAKQQFTQIGRRIASDLAVFGDVDESELDYILESIGEALSFINISPSLLVDVGDDSDRLAAAVLKQTLRPESVSERSLQLYERIMRQLSKPFCRLDLPGFTPEVIGALLIRKPVSPILKIRADEILANEHALQPSPSAGARHPRKHLDDLRDRAELGNREKGLRMLRELSMSTFGTAESQVGALMLDVDQLTIINRQHGEQIWDDVLLVVGALFAATVADFGITGRCGDDTYFAQLFDADRVVAMRVGRNAVRAVGSFKWAELAHGLHLTCSVTTLNEGESFGDAAIRASMGMKAVKFRGGDRVMAGPSRLSHSESRDFARHGSGG